MKWSIDMLFRFLILAGLVSFSIVAVAQDAQVLDPKGFAPASGVATVQTSDGQTQIKMAVIEFASNFIYVRVNATEKNINITGGDGKTVAGTLKHTTADNCVERPGDNGQTLHICYFSMDAGGNFHEFDGNFSQIPKEEKKAGNVVLAKHGDQIVVVLNDEMAKLVYTSLSTPEQTRLFIGDMKTQAYKMNDSIVCQNQADSQNKNPTNYQCFLALDGKGEVQKLDQKAILRTGSFSNFMFNELPVAN
jgi:hypothetical protein